MELLLYQQSKEENKINIRKVEEKDLLEVAKIKVETWRDTYKQIVADNKKYLSTDLVKNI